MPKKPWRSPRASFHSLIVACFGLGTADGTALDPGHLGLGSLYARNGRPQEARAEPSAAIALFSAMGSVLVTPREGRIGAAPCITTPPDMVRSAGSK